MRALAHPLRLTLLEVLREGPSTASRLARDLGESSGATSYHLRALAKAGLIEEAAGRGRGRERWWRRATRRILIPTGAVDPEGRALEARVRAVFLARDDDVLRRFHAHEPELETSWREAAFVGNWSVELTADEVTALGRRILDLVAGLRRPATELPVGTRRVVVTFRALPWLE